MLKAAEDDIKDINSYADYWLKEEEKQHLEPDVFNLKNLVDLLKGRK